MAQDQDNFLTPEQIWQDFKSGMIKNSEAVYLLKTIIEKSSEVPTRIKIIEILESLNIKNEEAFKIIESCLITDEEHIVREIAAKLLYKMFPIKGISALGWAIQHDQSPFVLKTLLQLPNEINDHYLNSLRIKRINDLSEIYGVAPEEIMFFLELEILGVKLVKEVFYLPSSPLLHTYLCCFHNYYGRPTYTVLNRKTRGLYLYGLEKIPESISALSKLRYLSISGAKSLPKSLSSFRRLKGLRLLLNIKGKKLKLPEDIINLKSLKELELSESFFNPASKPLISLIKYNIAPKYIKQGVHPEDAVGLGLLEAYLGRDIERDYGYQENRFDINEQGRVVSIRLLEDQGYDPFISIPEPVYNFRYLERLAIVHIHFSFISSKIKKLNRLRELVLHNNQLKTVPRFISKLRNLEKLILRGTKIEKFPEVLTSLTLLKYLDLSETNINTVPDSISNLTNLEYLGLPTNGNIPQSIVTLNLKYRQKQEKEHRKKTKKQVKKRRKEKKKKRKEQKKRSFSQLDWEKDWKKNTNSKN